MNPVHPVKILSETREVLEARLIESIDRLESGDGEVVFRRLAKRIKNARAGGQRPGNCQKNIA